MRWPWRSRSRSSRWWRRLQPPAATQRARALKLRAADARGLAAQQSALTFREADARKLLTLRAAGVQELTPRGPTTAGQAMLKDAATRARPMVEATPAALAILKGAPTRAKLVAADA